LKGSYASTGLEFVAKSPMVFSHMFPSFRNTNLQFKHVQRSEIAENLYQNHLHGIRGQGPLAGHQLQLRQVSRSASSGKLNLDKAQELLKGWTSGDLAIRCSTVDV